MIEVVKNPEMAVNDYRLHGATSRNKVIYIFTIMET
jgi:hypothetical protein